MSTSVAITEESWRSPEEEFRASFGIWIFLATEILLFGGMFLAYAVLRVQNYVAFDEAGRHASMFYGTLNTAILMTSSLFVAVAVAASEKGGSRALLRWCLIATLALGMAFLVVKGLEYHEDIEEHLYPGPGFPAHMPAAISFFSLYWVMTGLHAIHLTIGLGVVGRVLIIARRATLPANFHRTLEVSALYWHLIDVIWVLLYPIFYLVGRAT